MINVKEIKSIEIDGNDLRTLANICEIARRVTRDSSQVQDFKDKDINKIDPIRLCHDDYQDIIRFIDMCRIEPWGWS